MLYTKCTFLLYSFHEKMHQVLLAGHDDGIYSTGIVSNN